MSRRRRLPQDRHNEQAILIRWWKPTQLYQTVEIARHGYWSFTGGILHEHFQDEADVNQLFLGGDQNQISRTPPEPVYDNLDDVSGYESMYEVFERADVLDAKVYYYVPPWKRIWYFNGEIKSRDMPQKARMYNERKQSTRFN